MNGSEMIEGGVEWLGRNALVTLLPSVLIGWVCWKRWGSARIRWLLVGLMLVKLVTPGLPGWGWSVPGLEVGRWKMGDGEVVVADRVSRDADEGSVSAEMTVAAVSEGVAWWAVVWAMGVLGLGGAWVVGVVRVNGVIWRQRVAAPSWVVRLLAEESAFMGLKESPELCVLSDWGQAAVHGCWRARLLLPAAWLRELSEEELRAVLRHELAHVRRKDVLWSTLGYAVAAVHWFHPLGWLGLRQLRAEAELLCDEAALKGHGEAERKEYGRVLIRIMEAFPSTPPSAVAAFARHRNDIKHRILMIAEPNRAQRWSRAMAWLILPCVSLALLTAGEEREGEKEGVKDGEIKKEGPRDGDRPKEGKRDGEATRRVAPREGDGKMKRDGVTMGDRYSAIAAIVNGQVITRSEVRHEVEKSEGRLTWETAVEKLIEKEVNKKAVHDQRGRERNEGEVRDGDRRKEGARDGEATQRVAPREGKRDGEVNKGGVRDGDRSNEGKRDGAATQRVAPRESDVDAKSFGGR